MSTNFENTRKNIHTKTNKLYVKVLIPHKKHLYSTLYVLSLCYFKAYNYYFLFLDICSQWLPILLDEKRWYRTSISFWNWCNMRFFNNRKTHSFRDKRKIQVIVFYFASVYKLKMVCKYSRIDVSIIWYKDVKLL